MLFTHLTGYEHRWCRLCKTKLVIYILRAFVRIIGTSGQVWGPIGQGDMGIFSLDDLLAVIGDGWIDQGSWFRVSEELIIRKDRPFADKGGLRPVLLMSRPGPNSVIYTRSASCRGGFDHPKHSHFEGSKGCVLTMRGWVKTAPVTVPSSALNHKTYSCLEPDDTGLKTWLLSLGVT